MFRKVSVPLLGMIQNMSVFVCPHCQQRTHIFRGQPRDEDQHTADQHRIYGVEQECEANGIPFLGDVPLDADVCADADRGCPTVVREPQSERAKVFMDITEKIAATIGL